jgi:hypothetical protein
MVRSERRLAEAKENKISIHTERVVCQHMDAIRLSQLCFQGFCVVNTVIDFVSDWWHLKSVRIFGDSFCTWNEAMELAKNSRTLNKRTRCIFPVSSYFVFVRSVLALFSTCTLTYAYV